MTTVLPPSPPLIRTLSTRHWQDQRDCSVFPVRVGKYGLWEYFKYKNYLITCYNRKIVKAEKEAVIQNEIFLK